jgi:hypothetical protein
MPLAVILAIMLAGSSPAATSHVVRNQAPVKVEVWAKLAHYPAQIEIMHYPDDLQTFARISPQDFDTAYSAKAILYNRDRRPLEALVRDLGSVTFTRDTREADVRWGIVYLDRQGKRILTINADAFGAYGYVNGMKVKFDKRLIKLLESRFDCLESSTEREYRHN